MRKRFPASFYNLTTLFGFSVALTMFALVVFLIVLDSWRGFTNPYMGLITYIALPAVLLFGLVVGFVGIIRTRRRMVAGDPERQYPVIDLNSARARNVGTLMAGGGIVLMALSGFGTYQAYEYTESNKFCGETCHTVMSPEYTAFDHSPHAEIECKQCHIGPGAENYVESKMAGTKQLYAMVTGTYGAPIPTPVENLRDSKQTCERCHWTSQYYSPKMNTSIHYLADEANTPHQISMLVKVGSTEPGKSEGIHAHMYLDSTVSYIATDPQRQNIAYVELRDEKGNVIVYHDKENPLSPDKIRTSKKVTVNCTDCHNRPAHKFPHPNTSLDEAFTRGLLDVSIPEFKTVARDAMEAKYKTQKDGIAAIQTTILTYYKDNYPDVMKAKQASLDRSIAEVQKIFARSYFPEMKADWKAHPDNLDHIHSNGCFRCHDGKKVSPEGRVISKDCQTCHLIVAQGPPGKNLPTKLEGQEFIHPVDIGDAWKDTPCKDCHGASEDEEEAEE